MEHIKDTTVSTVISPTQTAYVIDQIYDSQYSPAQTGGLGVDLDSYLTFTTTSTASISMNATAAASQAISTGGSLASPMSSVFANGTGVSNASITANPGSLATSSNVLATASQ